MAQLATLYVGHKVGGLLTHNHAQIVKELTTLADLPGFTAFEATGSWMGALEPSTVIQILDASPGVPEEVARHLKAAFNQEAVLLTVQEVQATFI